MLLEIRSDEAMCRKFSILQSEPVSQMDTALTRVKNVTKCGSMKLGETVLTRD